MKNGPEEELRLWPECASAYAQLAVDLSGKSLVVIGGTAGCGLSTARAFVAAGANVVVSGPNRPNAERAARLLGPGAIAICADASDPVTATRAIAQAINAFRRFDGLYHMAGGKNFGDGAIDQITDAGWRLVMEMNLTSVMYSNRAAIRQFLSQHSGGSILNLGCASNEPQGPGALHAYSTAKSAVIGFSRIIAAHYASRNIRVNVLVPGAAADPETLHASPSGRHFDSPLPQTLQNDLDAAAIYFMSDGSQFTTGQVLHVDGGSGLLTSDQSD